MQRAFCFLILKFLDHLFPNDIFFHPETFCYIYLHLENRIFKKRKLPILFENFGGQPLVKYRLNSNPNVVLITNNGVFEIVFLISKYCDNITFKYTFNHFSSSEGTP